jgi:hypothetical protein
MPEFATVSLKEAQLRTQSGRRGKLVTEYAEYIQSLPQGQAGRLRCVEQENPLTIRRRLNTAAQALGIPLIIKRSGSDIYFWSESRGEEQPSQRRGRRPRRQEEPATPEQYFRETRELEQGETGGF